MYIYQLVISIQELNLKKRSGSETIVFQVKKLINISYIYDNYHFMLKKMA